MSRDSDSTDRKPTDYLLFAIACVGCVVAGGGGVIVGSPGLALSGATMALLALLLVPRAPSEG